MTSSSYPPGWYDDRSRPGFQRWWDGEAWTTHLRTPLPPGQPSQPPRPRPASFHADPAAAPVVGGAGWRRPQVLVPALVGLVTLIGVAVALSPPPDDQVVAGSGTQISGEPSSTTVASSSTTAAITAPPTTVAVTTEAPTTEAPTTEPPTTEPPTTRAPTTAAPTTTRPPTTAAPTTRRATTAAPAPSAAIKPLAGDCDPNYTGACVPIASDVDCEGNGGDGPAYVRGPVTVVGRDIYGLDGNDNDGIGCES